MQNDKFHRNMHMHAGLTTPSSDALPAGTPELYDNSEAERTLLQLGARWREMTKQPGAALPPEAAQLQQQQVRVMPLAQHRARSPETHHPEGVPWPSTAIQSVADWLLRFKSGMQRHRHCSKPM